MNRIKELYSMVHSYMDVYVAKIVNTVSNVTGSEFLENTIVKKMIDVFTSVMALIATIYELIEALAATKLSDVVTIR
jgi:hypothetical protein